MYIEYANEVDDIPKPAQSLKVLWLQSWDNKYLQCILGLGNSIDSCTIMIKILLF